MERGSARSVCSDPSTINNQLSTRTKNSRHREPVPAAPTKEKRESALRLKDGVSLLPLAIDEEKDPFFHVTITNKLFGAAGITDRIGIDLGNDVFPVDVSERSDAVMSDIRHKGADRGR